MQGSRTWKATAGVMLAALASAATAAGPGPGGFPERPMRIIVGFLPGGVSDTIARIMAAQLDRQMGQRVIIDGRPGAGGSLAMTIAANATPDGYTIFMGQPVITISPNFKRKFPYDPLKAFAPVSVIGLGATMMTVSPKTPASTVKEVIELAKSKPQGLTFGHSGQGSTNHLAGELFKVMAKVPLTAVAYKGAAANAVATIRGEIDISFMPVLASLPHVKAGRLKGIAVTGAKRAAAAPDIPTIAETLPGYEVPVWYGLVVPAATPAPVVAFLNTQVKQALETPAVRDQLASQGIEAHYTTRAEFAKLIDDDATRWRNLVRDAGIELH